MRSGGPRVGPRAPLLLVRILAVVGVAISLWRQQAYVLVNRITLALMGVAIGVAASWANASGPATLDPAEAANACPPS
jgi:hypothetical protein